MKRIFAVVSTLLVIDLGAWGYIHFASLEKYLAPHAVRELGIIQDVPDKNTVLPSVDIHFLDIGQGDATYIEFPDGTDMLVDCAKDARILSALGRMMQPFDRHLDYLIVTHPDMDHYGGCIDVLKRFEVGTIVYNGGKKEYDPVWRVFWETMKEEEATYKEIAKEETLEIAGAKIHFLFPDMPVATMPADVEVNNTSIVFTLRYGSSSVLFTADMEKEIEEYLVKNREKDLDVDILKVAHHGSPSSSFQPFLDRVSPTDAIISVGKENKYHHPSLRVIKRLGRAGARVWRTDEGGDITATLDIEHILVQDSVAR